MSSILVYNDSFFPTSQTFIYYQVQCLSEKYDVELLGKQFLNPHGYEIDSYKTYEIGLPKNILERAVSKVYRESLNSPLYPPFVPASKKNIQKEQVFSNSCPFWI